MNDNDILTAYLASLREAVGESQYELTKLLYCYNRFYGPNRLKRTMTYKLARVIIQVARLRKQIRRGRFLSDPRAEGLLPATQELVKFFSMHCGLSEEDQKVFVEEIDETTSSDDDFAHRKAFADFFQSKGEILETTMGQWIDNQIVEAEKVVKPHDEHRRGECEYVERFIASHPLYMSLDRMTPSSSSQSQWSHRLKSLHWHAGQVQSTAHGSLDPFTCLQLWLFWQCWESSARQSRGTPSFR